MKILIDEEDEGICYCGYPQFVESCLCNNYPICQAPGCENIVTDPATIHALCEECLQERNQLYAQSWNQRKNAGKEDDE